MMIRPSRSWSVNYFSAILALAMLALAPMTRAATYHVATTGDDSRDGKSKESAWKTITFAATQAQAGDTVLIQGGKYGPEHAVVANSGTADKPITFEGVGAEPVILDQGVRARDYKNLGLLIQGKSHVIVKNLNFTQYMVCVRVEKSSYVTLESVKAYDCGWTRWEGTGIALVGSNHCTLSNCTVVNAGGENFHLVYSDDNLIEGCKSIGTLDGANPYATDYYMVISWSSRNTIKNCFAEDQSQTGKGNHGIGVKDTQTRGKMNDEHGHSTGNKFIDCKTLGFEEGIFCAWLAYGNTYVNCYADCSKKDYFFANGIMVRDGAHDNLFENCTGIGSAAGLCIYDNENFNQNPNKAARLPQSGNKFVGCTFEGKARDGKPADRCVFMRNATGNTFADCSFSNSIALLRFGQDSDGQDKNSGNKFTGCKFSNLQQMFETKPMPYPWVYQIAKKGEPEITAAGYENPGNLSFTKCNFWKNGFKTPAGEGNTSKAPKAASNGKKKGA